MIKLGEYQTLTIKRQQPQGFYLGDGQGNEVLLPRSFITTKMTIGDEITVYVYLDSNDLEIATTEKPFITLGEFAYLQVTDVNKIGAFIDIGIAKDLLVPFRNQDVNMRKGHSYVIHMYHDELSDRLVGTSKIRPFLIHKADNDIRMGQEVDILVRKKSHLGYNVIVNKKYAGLVYENESNVPLFIGQELKGYVKPIRNDRKIDISLSPIGHKSIGPTAQKILNRLNRNKGFLPYTDKSDPELIRAQFGISKKLFKKSVGALYKQKLILLKKDGIYKVS